jgi:hypothetical protein
MRRLALFSAPPVISALLTVVLASPAPAQDAQSVLAAMAAAQAERWAGVDNYTVVKSVEAAGGLETPQYFVKMEVDGRPTFRLVPPPVYEREMLEAAGFPPPGAELYEGLATGYDLLGPALEQGGGDQPPMPGVSRMTSQISAFLREGADAVRALDDGSSDAEQAVADMSAFAARARLVGVAPVLAHPDGTMRDAYHLVVEDVGITQETGGGSFTLNTASMWIDTEHYLPYRLLMEGEVESEGRRSPLTIERLDLDYRVHGPLYVAHREVGRLSGIMAAMSDGERREMEDARRQLADAERQLAAMPDGAAKSMAERMLGPRIEEFRRMVEGEALESAVNVSSVAVNEGPPTPYGLGRLALRGTHGAMTMAFEGGDEGGPLVAELSIASGLSGAGEATFSLLGESPFPEPGGAIRVVDATGSVLHGGAQVGVTSATGSIVVVVRTDTRIAGTFEAVLTGTDASGADFAIPVDGTFDSGAPTGPFQAPRGSPIPAMFRPGG